jgi:hypothetical protein
MNIANKKGQIGATLTWFIAFTMIFFMLVVFVYLSSAIASKKAISSIFSSTDYDFSTQDISDYSISKSGVQAVLEKQIQVGGENRPMIIFLLSTLDKYLESNSAMKYLDNDINLLSLKEYSISSELIKLTSDEISKKEAIVDNLKISLNTICQNYDFHFPGIDLISDSMAQKSLEDFSKVVELNIPYRGNLVKIKYLETKVC